MTPDATVLLALAEGDCERIVGELLGQPANTVSSLAFVAAGAWLLSRAHHDGGWRWGMLGVATIAAGIGSVAFHGPMPASGQLLHDLGLVSMPLTVGAIEVGTRRGGLRGALLVLVPLLTAAGAVLAGETGMTGPLTTVTAVWAGLGVLFAWVRGGRPLRDLRWPALAVGATAALIGALLRFLGRTDGPLCEPSSLAQPHAGWHVLAAVAVGAFAVAAYGVPTARDRETVGSRP